MRQNRIAAVDLVTPELRATERCLDAALIQTARFTAILLEAHGGSGLAATVGHKAFEEAAGTFRTLAQARSRIVQTHVRLNEVKVQIGLRTYAGGNGGDKPDEIALAEVSQPELRVVA